MGANGIAIEPKKYCQKLTLLYNNFNILNGRPKKFRMGNDNGLLYRGISYVLIISANCFWWSLATFLGSSKNNKTCISCKNKYVEV